MDFSRILSIFFFFVISLVFKSLKEKQKIEKKNQYPKLDEYKETYTQSQDDGYLDESLDSNELYMEDSKLFMSKEERQEIIADREGYSMEWKDEFKNIDSKKTQNSKRRVLKNATNQTRDTIYENEIGSEGIEYRFSKNDLVKGIIISEILSKPKALRKN